MPTELDNALEVIIEELTAPGQPLETAPLSRFDTEIPTFKFAPPSLAHYFAHFCNEHKDAEFLVDGDVRLTFGECWVAATHVAAGLAQDHGVKKGDRVGIAARNSSNWIIAYMGIVMAGGCATLLNGFWNGDELAYGIKLAECELVLSDTKRAKQLEGTDHSAKVVIFEHNSTPEEGLAPLWGDGDTAMAMLGELGADDMATILYTSGSTGKSKAAWSDHRGVVNGVMNYIAQSAIAKSYMEGLGEDMSTQPCALIAVPLFHVTGEVPLFCHRR